MVPSFGQRDFHALSIPFFFSLTHQPHFTIAPDSRCRPLHSHSPSPFLNTYNYTTCLLLSPLSSGKGLHTIKKMKERKCTLHPTEQGILLVRTEQEQLKGRAKEELTSSNNIHTRTLKATNGLLRVWIPRQV